jgi:isocitrate dehydrogenase kinase/phosphatase
METSTNENPVAQAIAQAMIEGFNKHYRIFRETSRRAKESYEAADWQGSCRRCATGCSSTTTG